MQREFGDLQNLPQDLRSFGRFCGPQTVFAWDLDTIYERNLLVFLFYFDNLSIVVPSKVARVKNIMIFIGSEEKFISLFCGMDLKKLMNSRFKWKNA